MATSTFTRKIVLSDEAVDILAKDLSKDEVVPRPVVDNYTLDDEEFLEQCINLFRSKG